MVLTTNGAEGDAAQQEHTPIAFLKAFQVCRDCHGAPRDERSTYVPHSNFFDLLDNRIAASVLSPTNPAASTPTYTHLLSRLMLVL